MKYDEFSLFWKPKSFWNFPNALRQPFWTRLLAWLAHSSSVLKIVSEISLWSESRSEKHTETRAKTLRVFSINRSASYKNLNSRRSLDIVFCLSIPDGQFRLHWQPLIEKGRSVNLKVWGFPFFLEEANLIKGRVTLSKQQNSYSWCYVLRNFRVLTPPSFFQF